jgi:hypothetical protein
VLVLASCSKKDQKIIIVEEKVPGKSRKTWEIISLSLKGHEGLGMDPCLHQMYKTRKKITSLFIP